MGTKEKNGIETKTCKDCGVSHPLESYHYSDKKRGIRKSYCKDCNYKRAKEWFDKDPIAHQYYMNRYYKENPEKFNGNHTNNVVGPVAGVYIIECLLTDDAYIGCSSNLRNRRYKHSRNVGNSKNKPLSKLIKQYGWGAFSFDVLEECSREEMHDRETYYIQELKPNLNNYKTNK